MTRAIEGIILAGGASTRLGRPKSLVELDGAPVLARVRDTLVEAGVAQGVVVVGEQEAVIRQTCDTAPFTLVRNPDPAAGRTGSLQRGLERCAPEADVLLWPVDRPLAGLATVRALLSAREAIGDEVGWIVPSHEGRAGHPLVLRVLVRDPIRAARPDESLRQILRRAGSARHVVNVDDAGILMNIDTEDEWTRALAWWRARA